MGEQLSIEEYIEHVRPLSIYARFAIGLRLFERYVRLRGIEEDVIWEFIEDMWKFPLAENKLEWEKKRGDLADFGLGDELPDELDEELQTLGINEDYFSMWVSSVTELAWNNLLNGPQDEESLEHLHLLIQLAGISGVGAPELEPFQQSRYQENFGWGKVLTVADLERWQVVNCSVSILVGNATLAINEEAELFFD